MSHPTTPEDSEKRYHHYTTPTKAKVQGTVEFCDRMDLAYYKKEVFRTFGVSHRQGYEMLRDRSTSPTPRRRHNDPDREETRGRNHIISPREIREMERVFEAGIEGRR